MDAHDLNPQSPRSPIESEEPTLVELIPEFDVDYSPPPPPPPRRVWLPVGLFAATVLTTLIAGVSTADPLNDGWRLSIMNGLMYSGAVMTILLCHEMGHFLQAWRYGVPASLPYFLPMPLPPIGTFGAVIVMDPRRGDRKAIFDIGIAGPLAGLVPTFLFLWIGLRGSHAVPVPAGEQWVLGEPLVLRLLTHWIKGPMAPGFDLVLHPFAFAGWVGLLVTSLNLVPIGQLDGGHILYGMLRKKAHTASLVIVVLAIAISIAKVWTHWWLMLGLITYLGIRHPPTTDDYMPLGTGRYVLGILTLAFLILGFTPVPISLLQH
jgi:membrane-associated protease RseP (regulator of RpoE activity)